MPTLFADPVAAQEVYRASWAPFLAAWGHLVPERARVIGEWFTLHGATVWEQISAPPHTFMHGDFRLDNLLFDAAGAPEPLAVVDWQAVRLGKGVADVAYFAMSSLQPDHRKQWEAQLVDSYYAALLEHGVRGYDHARAASLITGWPDCGTCTRWS
jgi:aminoglycoside phosphotransferase (APT) family kinase protein